MQNVFTFVLELRSLLCKMSQIIEHTGKIQHITGNQVQVLITQNSACSACHAKSACTAADSAEKIVDALSCDSSSLKTGDDIIVYAQHSLGLKAVLLAFVVPFMLILTALFGLRYFTDNEALSGTIALATLIPYYIILLFFKEKLKAKFQFYVKTPNS